MMPLREDLKHIAEIITGITGPSGSIL